MEKKLESYIKIYDNWIDTKVCDQTLLEIEKADWSQHLFYNSFQNSFETISGNNELDISFPAVSNNEYIMKKVWESIFKYVNELNFSWWNSWNGFSAIRYNRYLENKLMANHCDHIQDLFDGERKGIPTLTCIGMLNDGYEGGDFIMFDNDKIELKKGSIMIFPSIFLYPHRVEPVIKGVRYSFVTWVW